MPPLDVPSYYGLGSSRGQSFQLGYVYKSLGINVKLDGTPIGVQKDYNAFCKRTN
jgi:hypothetical protein